MSLTRALSRPLSRSLVQTLTQGGSFLDADAAAYIVAITAAGATVSGSQRTAIGSFVEAEKAAGRWTGLKRFYLPIWGVAAANAICMKSLTSGTWVGGVTHASGYVQGNGSTGYFNTNSTPSDVDFTTTSNGFFCLNKTAGTPGVSNPICGLTDVINSEEYYSLGEVDGGAGILQFYSATPSINGSLSQENQFGIFTGIRNGADANIRRRTAIGASSIASGTMITSGNNISPGSIYFMALNFVDIDTQIGNNAHRGTFGICLGMDNAATDAFTANLKTLWETTTGLTLP